MSDNRYYIEKYKDFDKIIKTYYQVKDKLGRTVNIDGIVNPLKIDNRQLASVTDNQGQTPHCAAYSICNWAEAILWKRTGKLINLNADQVYAKAKELDGSPNSDGTWLEYAIKAAVQLGGFQTSGMNVKFFQNEGTQTTVEMLKFLIHKYDFLHAGFEINSGWYKATEEDPIIKKTSTSLGGHAVLLVGYDQIGVYIQNSWGKGWGSKGFAILPWSQVLDQLMYVCYLTGLYEDMEV